MSENRNIRLVDTTLRDGEQAPGVSFSSKFKVDILKMLYDAGIRDFEIGTPAIDEMERFAIKQMVDLELDANLSVWCRATLTDLQYAADLGLKMVNLSLPVSEIQINAIGKTEQWVIQQLEFCLKFASSHFDFVSIGAQDGSRADYNFLIKYINTAIKYKVVQRIRIADTVGILNPFSVFELFQKLKFDFPLVEFEFHGHNDLGMANANGLAAIKAGADLVSVTVNGLGERCGNTPLEELVIALQYSEGIDLGIKKTRLRSICDLVSILSARKINASKPFNGKFCFTHESGIHTRSLIIDILSYQPYRPEEVGAQTKFVFGKHSGRAAIKSVLKLKGIKPSQFEIDHILNQVKLNTNFSSSGFSENDVFKIYMKCFSKPIKLNGTRNYHSIVTTKYRHFIQ
ncbi:MAG: hypothetical protein PF541_06230 [Prolixibacteraceae bacterium]|jgi:homocitrate synthase NifV|nr:hypothetical protein [Prolixibacteraceae bacterium]